MSKHNCLFSDFPGMAIDECNEEDGELWVDNGEYSSRVNFCPACGYKAPKQIEGLEVVES